MGVQVLAMQANQEVLQTSEIVGVGIRAASVMQMVTNATRTTGCCAALICRQQNGELVVIGGTEDGPLRGIASTVLTAEVANYFATLSMRYDNSPSLADSFNHGDVGSEQCESEIQMPLSFPIFSGATVQFTAAIRIDCEDDAFLIVLHDKARSQLSAAQIYVLRAQASHLSTMFELADLRDKFARVEITVNQARSERLRVLESVAIHARDSIIITEAEPFDLPGPRIIYCNEAFTRATGYSVAEVIGQTPRILQGPKTDPEARAKMRAAF